MNSEVLKIALDYAQHHVRFINVRMYMLSNQPLHALLLSISSGILTRLLSSQKKYMTCLQISQMKQFHIFRSTVLSRPNKWVSNLRVRTYVRPSTQSFFDFNDIWHVGRGRWVMHDGMQYNRIQGQGHEPLKVGNPSNFKGYLLFTLDRDSSPLLTFCLWSSHICAERGR